MKKSIPISGVIEASHPLKKTLTIRWSVSDKGGNVVVTCISSIDGNKSTETSNIPAVTLIGALKSGILLPNPLCFVASDTLSPITDAISSFSD